MLSRHPFVLTLAMSAGLMLPALGEAQDHPPAAPTARRDTSIRRDSATALSGVRITAERDGRPAITQLTLPVSASISALKVRETVNLVDTPDAVKYLPSVFIRKRNNGDTQAVMATRVWGVSSSARSLIYADGVPLTALIANNNTIGGPRWGLVAPEEIERIDMMYGPFSAAYAGNSMGAVMEITTRMPERFEGSIAQTQAWQDFDLYSTKATYGTSQTSARIGNRFGNFSFVASGNYQDSRSQPLTYVTSGTFPSGTTGGIPGLNKLNAPANILGATGLLHTQMTNAKVKLAYDLTPRVRAAYTYGWWENDASAGVDSYLERSGATTFAGQGGFASGNYTLLQRHSSQSLSLRTRTGGTGTSRPRRRDTASIPIASAFRRRRRRPGRRSARRAAWRCWVERGGRRSTSRGRGIAVVSLPRTRSRSGRMPIVMHWSIPRTTRPTGRWGNPTRALPLAAMAGRERTRCGPRRRGASPLRCA